MAEAGASSMMEHQISRVHQQAITPILPMSGKLEHVNSKQQQPILINKQARERAPAREMAPASCKPYHFNFLHVHALRRPRNHEGTFSGH